jgi:hypothetical protein
MTFETAICSLRLSISSHGPNNDQAEEGSVSGTLENFFGPASETKIFGGHRPVKGKYDLRQDSRYVQFNRPDEFLLAIIEDITVFDPESDIIYL